MEKEMLKYRVITSSRQYNLYTRLCEKMKSSSDKSREIRDEIALLTVLIEKWDRDHSKFDGLDPVQLLHSFMTDHNLKAKDLVNILNVSKGYVSDILNYKKGLSKEIIRTLATYFRVSQETFNRPYKLNVSATSRFKEIVNV
jgi:HTH-type transcriptional regulator / antitoxin HigA